MRIAPKGQEALRGHARGALFKRRSLPGGSCPALEPLVLPYAAPQSDCPALMMSPLSCRPSNSFQPSGRGPKLRSASTHQLRFCGNPIGAKQITRYGAAPQSYEPFVGAHSPNAELSGRTRIGVGCGVGVAGTGVAVAVGAAVGAVVGACPEVAVGVGVPVSCVGSVVVVADGVPAASTAAPALALAS